MEYSTIERDSDSISSTFVVQRGNSIRIRRTNNKRKIKKIQRISLLLLFWLLLILMLLFVIVAAASH